MAEHPIGDAHIGALAKYIGHVIAPDAQNIGKDHRDNHPAVEHVKRGVGLRRDHPVIDLHREDNPHQRQQVDKEGSQHYVAVRAQIAQHQAPQPVGLQGLQIAVDAAVFGGGERAKSGGEANVGQERSERQRRRLLVAAEVHPHLVFAVEADDYPDLPVRQLYRQRQPPVVNLPLIILVKLQRHARLARQVAQRLVARLFALPLAGGEDHARRTGQTIVRGDQDNGCGPALERHPAFGPLGLAGGRIWKLHLRHGWISTDWIR